MVVPGPLRAIVQYKTPACKCLNEDDIATVVGAQRSSFICLGKEGREELLYMGKESLLSHSGEDTSAIWRPYF